jgi:hypothetical protein
MWMKVLVIFSYCLNMSGLPIQQKKNVSDLAMGVRSQKLIIFWLYVFDIFLMCVFDIQQDEDQEDPDERHDPDSDMEIDSHRIVEESTRSLSLTI